MSKGVWQLATRRSVAVCLLLALAGAGIPVAGGARGARAAGAPAMPSVSLWLGDHPAPASLGPPLLVEGTLMVPIRALEGFGAAVQWVPKAKRVRVKLGGRWIQATVGERWMSASGRKVELPQPALIVEGRLLVPARAVAEHLGLVVVWDASAARATLRLPPPPRAMAQRTGPAGQPGPGKAPSPGARPAAANARPASPGPRPGPPEPRPGPSETRPAPAEARAVASASQAVSPGARPASSDGRAAAGQTPPERGGPEPAPAEGRLPARVAPPGAPPKAPPPPLTPADVAARTLPALSEDHGLDLLIAVAPPPAAPSTDASAVAPVGAGQASAPAPEATPPQGGPAVVADATPSAPPRAYEPRPVADSIAALPPAVAGPAPELPAPKLRPDETALPSGLKVTVASSAPRPVSQPATPTPPPERSPSADAPGQPGTALAAPLEPDDGRKPLVKESPLAQVVGVAVRRAGGRTRVDILRDGPAVATQPIILSDPPRLVFDLSGAQLAASDAEYEIGGAILKRVRLGQQSGSVVRATLDLGALVGFSLKETPEATTVLLNHQVASVRWIPQRDGPGQLWIELSGYAPVRTGMLEDPLRMVVDIQEATLTQPAAEWSVSTGPVRRIRVSQFQPDVVRVVLELSQPVRPQVVTSADLARQGLERAGSTPPEAAGSPGGGGPVPLDIVLDVYSRITRVALKPVSRSGVSLVVEGTGALEPRPFLLRDPDRLVVDFPGAVLDPGAAGPGGELPGTGPVQAVRTGQFLPRSARVVVELNRPVGYRLVRSEESTLAVLALGDEPLAGRVVAIDAGHGGFDTGAMGRSGTPEKFFNLDIARRLTRLLQTAGARVVATRPEDAYVTLDDRVRLAQEGGAEAFVSIHNNASTSGQGLGTEVFYSTRVGRSRVLAELLYDALVTQLGSQGRGVKVRNDLRVLRLAPMPAALVEVAFVDHPEDEKRLLDPAFRQRAAEAMFSAIVSYFSTQGTDNTDARAAPTARDLADRRRAQ